MLTNILISVTGALLGGCGLLYGLWQRSRVSTAQRDLSRAQSDVATLKLQLSATVNRYEQLLAQREAELEMFRKELDALPPAALRDRFNGLFPPKPKA